jgi:hypothetical protein
MSKLVDRAKQVASAGSAAATAWSILVKVEGAPVRKRDEPAAVKVAGLTLFRRYEDGQRVLFGIPLGKRQK